MYAATHHNLDDHRLTDNGTLTDAVVARIGSRRTRPGHGRRTPLRHRLPTPSLWADTGPRAYGHDGAGGALGKADSGFGSGLGFAYLTNRMILIGQPYQRVGRLLDAAHQCVQDD